MLERPDVPDEHAREEIARKELELLELLWAPPLISLTIGGAEFQIGELAPWQVAELMAYGEHCAHYGRSIRKGDKVSQPGDLVATRALEHLLCAGNPDVDFSKIMTHVKPEHVVAASKEMVRQAVALAMADPSPMAGRRQANRTTAPTSDFAGREKRAA